MFKQSLIYLLISCLVIVFAKFAHLLVIYIDMLYTFINLKLSPIFSWLDLSDMICKILLLVLIPVTITAIPALSYRLIRGKDMPYFIETTWCLWLVIVLSHILVRY